jgi:hypothetical protein
MRGYMEYMCTSSLVRRDILLDLVTKLHKRIHPQSLFFFVYLLAA